MAKLSISKAWEDSREVLSRDGKLIGALALAMFFLPGVIAGVIRPEGGGLPTTGGDLLLMTVVTIVGVIGQLAVIRLALGAPSTVGDAIRHGASRAAYYIAANLLWLFPLLVAGYFLAGDVVRSPETAGLASALAFLALLAVMIFISVRMLMTSPVATAETLMPIAILKRSWRLTAGHWWRLFGFMMLFLLLVLVLLWAASTIVGIVGGLLFGPVEPMTLGALFVAFFIELVTMVLTVGFLIMLARIYAQLSGPAHAAVSVPSSGD